MTTPPLPSPRMARRGTQPSVTTTDSRRPTIGETGSSHVGSATASPAGKLTDEELARGLRACIPPVWEYIFRAYRPRCVLLARRLLVDVDLAEDVAQEVLADLWRLPDRYDPTRGSLSTWLLVLTHHKAVDVIRSRQRRRVCEAAAACDALRTAGVGRSAADEIIREDDRRQLAVALTQLPADVQEVLTLAYFHDLSQTQIAAVTGTPLGTVKYRCVSGKRQLALLLADLDPRADRLGPIPTSRSGTLSVAW